MSDFHGFYVESGETIRLKTAGKYCDRDIYVSGIGGVEDLDEVLTEQESLIDELKAILDTKAAGSGEDVLAELLTNKMTEPLI